MSNGHFRPQTFYMSGQHFAERSHGFFSPPLKTDPDGIAPVDAFRNFLSAFPAKSIAAGIAGADQRPECHINKQSLDRVGDHFFDLLSCKRLVSRVVRTAEMVPSGGFHSVDVSHPPLRVFQRRAIMINHRIGGRQRRIDRSRHIHANGRIGQQIYAGGKGQERQNPVFSPELHALLLRTEEDEPYWP